MTKSQVAEEVKKDTGSIPFVKEVAHYFMDFLETNFHKVRTPKRHFQQRDNNNLQVSVKLEKYQKYNALAWKVIRSGFKDDALNELKHGVYKNQIPKNLLQLIQQQIDLISQKDINKVIKKFHNEIDVGLSKHPNDVIDATAFALYGITRVIKEEFLAPFIEKISEPLEKIKTTTADSVYQIEEELTDIFISPFEEIISMAITSKSLEQEFDVDEKFSQNFELSDIQNKLSSFFKGFAIADIFFEMSELVNNKNLLEKQEFYLNFCDITYKDRRYPLFYIPVQITKAEGTFQINFDSLLYVNKKAIQYVSQSYNAENERKSSSLGSFMERIIYIAEKQEHLIGEIDRALKEAITYFGLSPYIDINNPEVQIAKGNSIQISNRCYFGLFDKSDESLVNDYEEILQKLNAGDDILASAFEVLIDDFIKENPVSVVSEVEHDWDGNSSPDKLVYSSPIPLNEEQRQILTALNKSKCKYTTVEGPPGTGKSHTITAIICDAILNNKSTLVLSDKKEALDVVEDKITETMNKVRFDKNFQNPILRLGKTGSTYSKILSTTAMESIKEHYKAIKNDYGSLEDKIQKSVTGLKDKISGTIKSYESVDIPEIDESKESLPFDLEELYKNKQSDEALQEVKTDMLSLKEKLSSDAGLKNLFGKLYPDTQTIDAFQSFLTLIEIVEATKEGMQARLPNLAHIPTLSEDGLESLGNFIYQCKQIRAGLFGYLFKGKQLRELSTALQKDVRHDFEKPHLCIEQLEAVTCIFRYAEKVKTDFELSRNFQFQQDFIEWVCLLLKTDITLPDEEERKAINDTMKSINNFAEKYPDTTKKAGLYTESIFGLFDNAITKYPEDEFNSLVRYIFLKNSVSKKFRSMPQYSYTDEKADLENLVTTQMTYKLDERVVDFYNNKRNDPTSLKKIISKKQRFDKKVFEDLKNAFPCILAGIRDFAEYIPLESEIFDIVIIDEASQVSIAQAFP
ncbi:AAA domain-containing protein, partial [Rickettsiales bacterium]|nr:AAA domain-containing protein [Rickettsiales bacterium]